MGGLGEEMDSEPPHRSHRTLPMDPGSDGGDCVDGRDRLISGRDFMSRAEVRVEWLEFLGGVDLKQGGRKVQRGGKHGLEMRGDLSLGIEISLGGNDVAADPAALETLKDAIHRVERFNGLAIGQIDHDDNTFLR